MPNTKPKRRFAINVNGRRFPLTDEESTTLVEHDRLWNEHCASIGDVAPSELSRAYHDLTNRAKYGDEDALAEIQKYGSRENFIRQHRLLAEGRTAAFHRKYAPLFAELHPIAKRIKNQIIELRDAYIAKTTELRAGLNLGPIADDYMRICDDHIGTLSKIENHRPAGLERFADHCHELQPIDE
jgi:hypothetical protein